MNDYKFILCVAKDGELHQVMLSDSQMTVLETIAPVVVGGRNVVINPKPICNIELLREEKAKKAEGKHADT